MEMKRKAEIVENCVFFSEMSKKTGSDTSLSLDFSSITEVADGKSGRGRCSYCFLERSPLTAPIRKIRGITAGSDFREIRQTG